LETIAGTFQLLLDCDCMALFLTETTLQTTAENRRKSLKGQSSQLNIDSRLKAKSSSSWMVTVWHCSSQRPLSRPQLKKVRKVKGTV
jgi:hypothetical protein